MKRTAILSALQQAFFQWGWLLPTVLPLTQLGGRALFNSFVGLYALWGLLALWSRRRHLDPAIAWSYLILLTVFLLGVPGAFNPSEAARTWAGFLMQSLTLPLMQVALRESPNQPARLLDAMALFGGLSVVGLLLLLPYHVLGWSGQPFDPGIQLQEDNLPFLLPFLLYGLWCRDGKRWRGAMFGVVTVVLGYITLAEGRAALLALIVGLTTFCWAVLGWRLRWSGLAAATLLLVAVSANLGPFQKAALDPTRPVDAFTSGRTILWRQALQHPPERPWLGLGMGNAAYADAILRFELGGEQLQVRHLHNVLLDMWYETGLLGLSAFLVLIGVVGARLASAWRRLAIVDRQRAGVLLAAALALATAGLLSFSYTSRYFACYFFACLGGLSALATTPAGFDRKPDRR